MFAVKINVFQKLFFTQKASSGPLHWKNFQKTLIFALFLEIRTLFDHWLRLEADEVLLLTLCAKMNNLCKINCPENTTETAINFKFIY